MAPKLSIPAELLTTDSAAYILWQNLMTFANVGMIIILLIVIFSQLTGYGIDNYGIKKMLPKILVAAVLINLSFFICQIAVDMSNIFGRGIVELGRNLRDLVKADAVETGIGAWLGGLFAIASGSGAAAGTVTSVISLTGVTVASAPAWIIPLVFVALTALVALIGFFLILALRRLLAVVLVIVSPLAMLCYVLPNTQKIFKKWLELFKTILVIYPVCAGLYAVAKIMRAVAYSAEGTHIGMVMVAFLIGFVPFFAAPVLIKKALAAFGELGNWVSKMSDGAKAGVREGERALQNSAAYKNLQREASVRRADNNIKSFKAVNDAKKAGKKASFKHRFRAWSAGGERGYARNLAFLDRSRNEDVDSERISMREDTGNYNVEVMGNQLKHLLDEAEKRELTDKEKQRVEALSSQLSSQSGGSRELANAANNRTGRSAQILGEYMARNNTVSNALGSKRPRTSSRISDIAAGVIDANTKQRDYDKTNNAYMKYRREAVARKDSYIMTESEWRTDTLNKAYATYSQNETNAGRTALSRSDWDKSFGKNVIDETTVVQNIARNIVDKDKELVSLSGGELQELLPYVGQDRIRSMASNPNLFSYGDVAAGAKDMVLSMVDQEYIDSSGNEVKIRNIKKDDNGNVTSYEVDTGTGYTQQSGSLSDYTSKADQEQKRANDEQQEKQRQEQQRSQNEQQRYDDMLNELKNLNQTLQQQKTSASDANQGEKKIILKGGKDFYLS